MGSGKPSAQPCGGPAYFLSAVFSRTGSNFPPHFWQIGLSLAPQPYQTAPQSLHLYFGIILTFLSDNLSTYHFVFNSPGNLLESHALSLFTTSPMSTPSFILIGLLLQIGHTTIISTQCQILPQFKHLYIGFICPLPSSFLTPFFCPRRIDAVLYLKFPD